MGRCGKDRGAVGELLEGGAGQCNNNNNDDNDNNDNNNNNNTSKSNSNSNKHNSNDNSNMSRHCNANDNDDDDNNHELRMVGMAWRRCDAWVRRPFGPLGGSDVCWGG